MKLAIGGDHRGFLCKQHLIANNAGLTWIDVGTHKDDRIDFPQFAAAVAKKVQSGEVERGVLMCGSGMGMSIVANRFKGVYATVVWSKAIAKSCREHNNSNLLIIPADHVSCEEAQEIFEVWRTTDFLGDVYQKRIEAIDALDQ